jgi:predicted ATP-dependent endonuclease of OLD family
MVAELILTSVRIENFKSIEDSNEFSVQKLTCLVGKNEAGKTTILQALYKLNPDIPEKRNFDELLDYPRRRLSEYQDHKLSQPDNILTTKWELEPADMKDISNKFGDNVVTNKIVKITKGYDNTVKVDFEFNEKQLLLNWAISKSLTDTEKEEIGKHNSCADLITSIKKPNPSASESKILSLLQSDFPNGPKKEIDALLAKSMPIFLYFSDFYRMAGRVSLPDFINKKNQNKLEQQHRIFEALLKLAGTTPEEVDKIGTSEALIAQLEAISNKLSQEIFDYWSQNTYLKIEFRFDSGRPQDSPPFNNGYVFHTRIQNTRHGVSVRFEERSQGFVWFFSFLVWFSQLKKIYGEKLIVLLDDPGLSLHARAQADLLRYIKEKLLPHYQVIYTTHSPFMIDPDNLLSVRTVEDLVKTNEILGTKVQEQGLGTDPDTVCPLQAALGYDLVQTLFVGKHNLLVEGPSDLLYIKYFSRELQKLGREQLDPRWVVVPCGGVEKIGTFMSLFKGNNLDVAVFTDCHNGIKNKIRTLRESKILKSGNVFSADIYTKKQEADIEDMIGRSNYIELLRQCYSVEKINLPDDSENELPILKEVEQYFKSKQLQIDFDHYEPARYLTESKKGLKIFPHTAITLDMFEDLFKDLNALLPSDDLSHDDTS